MTTFGEAIRGSCKMASVTDAYHSLQQMHASGLPKGISTGWLGFDRYFKILKGQLNVLSGVPSSGKSEWLESMAINLALTEKWRILVYSPENYPLSFYLVKLCEKIVGKPFWGRGDNPPMNKEELMEAHEFLNQNFEFIDSGDEIYGLDRIFNTFAQIKREGRKIDMVILDPWNEVEITRPKGIIETDYIGECLSRCRRFTRQNSLSFWIVAHPTKMRRDKNGNFPEPTLYDVSGSAHWKNKVDNAIILHRQNILDSTDLIVKARVVKIKNRFYGMPGEHYFQYQPWNSRYVDAKKPEEERLSF